jgi:hypothetical protein
MPEREPNGRWLPGCAAGPGRPRRATEAKYQEALVYHCPVDAWGRIVAKAVQQAEEGDFRAREFLARHLLSNDPPQLQELVEQLQAELERVTARAN